MNMRYLMLLALLAATGVVSCGGGAPQTQVLPPENVVTPPAAPMPQGDLGTVVPSGVASTAAQPPAPPPVPR